MSEMLHKLRQARDREIVSEISYQFCDFLKRTKPDCPDEVLLAACLVSERNREGDVCVELDRNAEQRLFADSAGSYSGIRSPGSEQWLEACRGSHCVGSPGEATPLILDRRNRLYLQKYWRYEREVADRLLSRASLDNDRRGAPVGTGISRQRLNALFGENEGETNWQKVAAYTALSKNLTVISGGPGTGKTYTVAKILVLLAESESCRHMALAAPTGKAAARLRESVRDYLDEMELDEAVRDRIPEEAFTVHKLLGARKHRSEYRYSRKNPLPYDAVVVDEVSMVDLAMMYRLLDALPAKSKLILLGDKDQLASVEAGAVLGSICEYDSNRFSPEFMDSSEAFALNIPQGCAAADPKPITDHIVLLEKNYRFGSDSGIGSLSEAILAGDPDAAVKILESEDRPDVELKAFDDADDFREIMRVFADSYFDALRKAGGAEEAIGLISRFGILGVHRRGPLGTIRINNLVEQLLRTGGQIPPDREWYDGKPVMATRNDYSLGLRNGDLGITLTDEEGRIRVWFEKEEGEAVSFHPSRLSHVETSFAVTVHKSQGSEFDNVAIILPGRTSKISTRELLYTAVTRARKRVTIVGSTGVLRESITRGAVRSSGLRDKLWDDPK